MVKFPSQFPQDSITTIVQNWQKGTLATNKALVAEAAWNIQGFAIQYMIGTKDTGSALMGSAPPVTGGQAKTFATSLDHDAAGQPIDQDEVLNQLSAYCDLKPTEKGEVNTAILAGSPLPTGIFTGITASVLLKFATKLALEVLTEINAAEGA